MIVTFWPSSRRLAMRPPHERATSSGRGATKTCVMAGRVYPAAPSVREPPRPDERHEDTGAVARLDPFVAVAERPGQHLPIAGTHRDHQSAAVAKLLPELVGDRRRRGRHDDPV